MSESIQSTTADLGDDAGFQDFMRVPSKLHFTFCQAEVCVCVCVCVCVFTLLSHLCPGFLTTML